MSTNSGKPDEDRGDSRNTTSNDPDQATQKQGTNAGKVAQNITTGSDQSSTGSSSQQGNANQSGGQQKDTSTWQRENKTQPQRKPGQHADSPGQESGTDWQESQQAGYTGRTGVQNPQEE